MKCALSVKHIRKTVTSFLGLPYSANVLESLGKLANHTSSTFRH